MQDSSERPRPPAGQAPPWYPPPANTHPAYHPQHNNSHSQSSIAPYPPTMPSTGSYPPSPNGNGNSIRSRFDMNAPTSTSAGMSDARVGGSGGYGTGGPSAEPWMSSGLDRPPGGSPPKNPRYHDPYAPRDIGPPLPHPMSADPYRSNYGNGGGPGGYPPMPNNASSSSTGGNGLGSALHTPTSSNAPHFSSDAYMGGHHVSHGGHGGPMSSSGSSRDLMSPDLDDGRHASSFAAFGRDVAPSLGLGEEDGDNRTRNAKAQKRHREKRKAFVKHLETSNAVLQNEIRRLNSLLLERGGQPAGPRCPGGPNCPSNEVHSAALIENRELLEQMSKIRAENDDLRGQKARALTGTEGAVGGPPAGAGGAGGGIIPAIAYTNGQGGQANGAGVQSGFGGGGAAGNFDPTFSPRPGAGSDSAQSGTRQFANNYLPPPSSLIGPGPAYASTSSQHYLDSKTSGPLT